MVARALEEGAAAQTAAIRSSIRTLSMGGSQVTVGTPRGGGPPPPPQGPARRKAITEGSTRSQMGLPCAWAKLEREALLRWARKMTKKDLENCRRKAALRRPGHLFNEKSTDGRA